VLIHYERPDASEEGKALHSEESHNLFSSLNAVSVSEPRQMMCGNDVYDAGGARNAFQTLTRKSQRRILPGRPRRMWEDNIKICLREIGCDFVNWIVLA
jgi:hypothetical protein